MEIYLFLTKINIMIKKILLKLPLLAILVSVSLFGQTTPVTESFSNIGNSGSYGTSTWTGDDGGTWTATDAREDESINGKAITIRDGKLTSPSITGGAGTITLTTQRKFGDSGSGDLTVYVNDVLVGVAPYDASVQTSTITANVSGSFVLTVETPSNGNRIAIDDLSITAFSSSDNVEIIYEDFQDCDNISFTAFSVSSTANWECSNSNGYEQINAYNADEAADDYLISEELNLDTYSNEVLTFESYNQYSDDNIDGAEVELLYTTAYTGDPSTTTWQSIDATFASADSETWTPSGDVNLSAISGNAVRIAFHYTSSGTGPGSSSLWRIDDVELSGVLGNVGPAINNISQSPATGVTPSDAVTVSADVTDSDGIASVVLNWGTESGNLPNEITMNLSSGDTYVADTDIPAQADGTTVYYEIVATDANTSPETSTSTTQNYTSLELLSLIISEVADPGNTPNAKFVEVYNNGSSTIDFSSQIVYLARYSNGNTTTNNSSVELTGTLAPGDYYVIAYSSSAFPSAYGFEADLYSGFVSGNGDDVYALYQNGDENSGTLLDIYGEIGVDGTGEAWEYKDSRAVRNSLSYEPSATWIASQWDITAANTEDMTPNSGEAVAYTYSEGTWSPANPEGNVTSSDNIVIENGQVNFSSDIEVNDLIINSDGALTVEAVLGVNGDITNNGSLTFISNNTSVGQLGEFNGSITGNDINVQRYIPGGNRAFRFLTSTVTTSTSIHANWQENDVSSEGYGIHITGSTDGSNGFDATPSGNPSLFGFDNANEAWFSIDNTDVNTLVAGEPYRVFVRGDRTIDVSQNSSTATATTLRATGTLATGDQTTNLANTQDNFNFIGNPYQAIVDMNLVLDNSTNLNTNQYYVWDPNMNTQGAYVTVDLSTGAPTPSGSAANQFIQPGQAAFVTTLTNADASILFEESDKATGESMTGVFRNSDQFNTSTINIDLQSQLAYANNGSMADGALLKFVANASNGIEANDAAKLGNIDETLSIVNGGHYLSIETRDLPQIGEVIPFYLSNYRQEDYVFRINLNNINGVTAYLVDEYLGTQTPLVNNEENVISFNVNEADEESVSPTRFSITFADSNLANTTIDKNSFALYPNPTNTGEFTIQLAGSSADRLEVKVFDMLGKQVYGKQFETFENQIKVTEVALQTGIYLVQLNQKGKTYTQKLIVK